MPQTPDSATVLHCLARAEAIHGAETAQLLADAVADAWNRSADQGPNAALLASGWLSLRALHFRDINPAISAFLNRLAELSAGAWADELQIQTTRIPDNAAELEGDPNAYIHQRQPADGAAAGAAQRTRTAADHPERRPAATECDGPAVSILSRRTAQPETDRADTTETDPVIVRRLAEIKADDLSTWQETGGDLTAWPNGWNDPTSDSYIEPATRPHYRRDRAEDLELVQGMTETVRRDNARGLLVPRLTAEQAERLCHAQAVRRAQALRKQADNEAREAHLDRTLRRCSACGSEGDRSVQTRPAPAWRIDGGMPFTARLCDRCAVVLASELDALVAEHVEQAAAEATPQGNRGDAVRAWLQQNRLTYRAGGLR